MQAVAEEVEAGEAGGSKHLLRLTDALAPIVGTALGMGDGENHGLLPPDHVGDVVIAETRLEVRPVHGSATDVVEQRVLASGMAIMEIVPFKRGEQLLVNAPQSASGVHRAPSGPQDGYSTRSWPANGTLDAQPGKHGFWTPFGLLGREKMNRAIFNFLHPRINLRIPLGLNGGCFSLVVTAGLVEIFMMEIPQQFLSLIGGKAANLLLDAFHGGSHDLILP